VTAWVKNDHLGFEVSYIHRGIRKKYRPDFPVRMKSGKMPVREVKGQDTEESQVKRRSLEWWIKAVNAHGSFGRWSAGVSFGPTDVVQALDSCPSKAAQGERG
jgi:type III restriction enzyme